LKVPAGNQAKELINFFRGQFGDVAYTDLPAGLGYCVPEDSALVDEATGRRLQGDAPAPPPAGGDGGDDGENIIDTLFSFDETTRTLTIAGLGSAAVPAGLGDAGLDVVSMTPPYGQETCGLVQVTQVVIPAATSIPGAVSTAALQQALEDTAPTGATVEITSVETSVESSFQLPVGTELDDDKKAALREQIAATYGGSASQVQLGGVRRRRRLQVDVTYTFTTTDPLASPDTAALTSAIATATDIDASALVVADPAEATVATSVEYTVAQDAGTSADDAAALATTMVDTSGLVTALGDTVTDAGGSTVSSEDLTSGITATTETPVVVATTTTAEAAAAANLVTTEAVAAPVPCAGRWGAFSECTAACGGGTQTRTYTVESAALNGGEACPQDTGATENSACNAGACIVPPPPPPAVSPTGAAAATPPGPSPAATSTSGAVSIATSSVLILAAAVFCAAN
jgi:hypothetical protein